MTEAEDKFRASVAADFDAAVALRRGERELEDQLRSRVLARDRAITAMIDSVMAAPVLAVAAPIAAVYGLEARALLIEHDDSLELRLKFWRGATLVAWLQLDGECTMMGDDAIRDLVSDEVEHLLRKTCGAPA